MNKVLILVLGKASTVDIAASLDLLAIIESMRGKQVAFNHQVRDIGLTSICSFIHICLLWKTQRPPKFKILTSPKFCTSAMFINSIDQKQSLQEELFGPICFVGAFVVYWKYCQNCGTYWESERHSVWGQNSNSIFFCFDQIVVHEEMPRFELWQTHPADQNTTW